ncbi:DUF397 domain-containing protein [Actinomadura sp. WMMB 499]|uniref:DUF397 domain-containing protein n=1 Tax=Actinomadura sp. WMMB 499 TaxID=1219491 RepID=UPI001243C7F7|nr:DUF397 domain-containing protein [Actinomadura sp. WMMB 499]QFG24548.1 DUF397 domain-containing protein [Actinomadura sp. WMMB 499]
MIEWRKSSRSSTSGQSNCVEVANLPGSVAVRDSRDPDGPMLVVRRDVFAVLVKELK